MRGACRIQSSLHAGPMVTDAQERVLRSVDEALAVISEGEAHRHVGRTDMNEVSSRSHSIFRLVVESVKDDGSDSSDDDESESETKAGSGSSAGGAAAADGGALANDGDAVQFSVLNLLDLAGSERVKRTGAVGDRKAEGISINKSLLTLTTVRAPPRSAAWRCRHCDVIFLDDTCGCASGHQQVVRARGDQGLWIFHPRPVQGLPAHAPSSNVARRQHAHSGALHCVAATGERGREHQHAAVRGTSEEGGEQGSRERGDG